MPIYEYRCRKGHVFEVMQSMTDEPVANCRQCSEPVERVFHPVAVHFKGSGFYTTDYGRNRSAGSSDSKGREGEAGGSKPTDGEASASKPDSSKPDSAKTDSAGSPSKSGD